MVLTRRETMAALGLGAAALSVEGRAIGAPPVRRQRLWYRQPAAQWTEALPLGNGRIAAPSPRCPIR